MVYSVYVLDMWGFSKIREFTNKKDAQDNLNKYIEMLQKKPIFIKYLKNNPHKKLGFIRKG